MWLGVGFIFGGLLIILGGGSLIQAIKEVEAGCIGILLVLAGFVVAMVGVVLI